MYTSNHRGFAALSSVLFVSILLSVYAIYASADVWIAQQSVSDEYSYRASIANAWSCGYFALTRLATDPDRFTNTPDTTASFLDGSECTVVSTRMTDSSADLQMQGHVGNSYVDMSITATRISSTSPFTIESWEIL